jgi:hypothetical protein
MSYNYSYTSAPGRLLRYGRIVLAALIAASYLLGRPPAASLAAPGSAPGPQAGASALQALPVVNIRAAEPAAEAGQAPATLTVARSGDTAAPLKVRYSVAGTATPGDDYAPLSGSVTIPAGASSATIMVEPIDDTAKEGAETLIVSLNIAPGYSIEAPTSATVKIADDDMPEQVVSFYVGDSNAAEPGLDTGAFTIVRDGSTAAPLTVLYAVGGTATPGADYAVLPGSVVIPAGQASVVLKLAPVDDAIVEAAEIVVLSITLGAGYSIGAPASATVAITDNDIVPSGAPAYSVYVPALLRGK